MALRGASRVGLTTLGDVGSVKEGFKLVSRREHSEYGVEAAVFQHSVTGARYVHVDTEDTNNVFCIGFCTPCKSDSGIAHILEHTALCGSEQYPVRDPFFKMRSRSLSTFMNAFTYPDATMYPFSTVNEKDFYNLMGVYMDAALFPLLRGLDFKQEGHRLEVDDNGDFIIKGVVFNEMKGVYGDPSTMFYLNTLNEAYGRDSCYGYAFGGLPKKITELTHQNLVDFHKENYSVGNCNIATYGDLAVEENLARINEVLMRRFEREGNTTTERHELNATPKGYAAHGKKFSKSVVTTGPLDPLQDEATTTARVAIAWVMNIPTDDTFTIFALSILSALLTNGPNAPLYQILIENGVGTEFTSGTGFSADLKGGFFEIGVQGVNLEVHSTEKVSKIIRETLEKAEEEGFAAELVESVLHQVELSKSHRSANWGLNLVAGMIHNETQGYETHSIFEASARIKELREKLVAEPKFLQSLIRSYVLENKHEVTHTMLPDAGFSDKLAEEEKNVQTKELAVNVDKEEVIKSAKVLEEEMSKTEDLSLLPSLSVADIPRDPLPDPKIVHYENESLAKFQQVVTPTNGIWYFRLAIPIYHLTSEELLALPLLCSILGSTGAGDLDYRELSQQFKLCSSGVGFSAGISTLPRDPAQTSAYMTVSSYGLERNWERFFELLGLVFSDARMSSEDEGVRVRIKSIINMEATDASNGVVSSGHAYALKKAASMVHDVARCSGLLDGLDQVAHLVETMALVNGENGEEELTKVIETLKTLAGKLMVALPGTKANVTSSRELTTAQKNVFDSFIASLKKTSQTPVEGELVAAKEKTERHESGRLFIQAPADVGFMASVCFRGVFSCHRVRGSVVKNGCETHSSSVFDC